MQNNELMNIFNNITTKLTDTIMNNNYDIFSLILLFFMLFYNILFKIINQSSSTASISTSNIAFYFITCKKKCRDKIPSLLPCFSNINSVFTFCNFHDIFACILYYI